MTTYYYILAKAIHMTVRGTHTIFREFKQEPFLIIIIKTVLRQNYNFIVCVCVCLCMYVYIYVCAYVRVYTYIYVCVCVCMCVCF